MRESTIVGFLCRRVETLAPEKAPSSAKSFREGDQVVICDETGNPIARFDLPEVISFTTLFNSNKPTIL
jgi:hypothetical protein